MAAPTEQPRERPTEESQVAKFFAGKSILITGAAGFVGAVLLETLLRCCPDIKWIYILLRPKRGLQPEDRKEQLFRKDIFFKIKESSPDLLSKVVVVSGDTSKKNLGMSDKDLSQIREDVTIVFHIAAAISFMKPLRFLLEQNLLSTSFVLELCRSLKKLDILVYTSTAFANTNKREPTYEKVYALPFTAEKVLEMLKSDSDEELESLYNSCEPKFPNCYCFSKCLSENLIKETASDMKVSIVRPSIIVSCWKGILPGFVEGDSGIVNICVGIGKGFIRVMPMDENKIVDYIPVDIVANTHILAAWRHGTQSITSPTVYNCATYELAPSTWGNMISQMFNVVQKYPLPNSFQKPAIRTCKNLGAYWSLSILEHYIPALVIDALLYVSSGKPKLFNLYRFYDKAMTCLRPFMYNDWHLHCDNFKALSENLNSKDSENFYVDISSLTMEAVAKVLPSGAPVYKWENDKRAYNERMRTSYLRYCFTSCIKWTSVGSIILLALAVIC